MNIFVGATGVATYVHMWGIGSNLRGVINLVADRSKLKLFHVLCSTKNRIIQNKEQSALTNT